MCDGTWGKDLQEGEQKRLNNEEAAKTNEEVVARIVGRATRL
jgi:hypothetical protein